jgi:uncharacterized membrane protein HdeD (DUF308 family)
MTAAPTPSVEGGETMAEATWMEEAKKNAGLLIFLGILTVIFGVLAIAAPFITGVAVAIFVGSLLVLTGISQLVHAFKAKMWGIGFWGTVIGLLSIAAGLYMIFRPGVGLAALTMLLAIYFLVDGISEIIAAFRIKPDQGWGWVLFNGIIAVLLGFMIWRQWPASGGDRHPGRGSHPDVWLDDGHPRYWRTKGGGGDRGCCGRGCRCRW